ncbi:MAG: type II toxin-antitoxin system HicB family antitoxin [Planctomycetota bacterium]
MLTSSYNVVIRQEGEWWIGCIEEVAGVNSRGATRDQPIANLRGALAQGIEMNRYDAGKAAGAGYDALFCFGLAGLEFSNTTKEFDS